MVGQLNWAVQGSRPEMSFGMIQMSTKLKQGRVEDLVRAIKKTNKMKEICFFLTFPKLNKCSEIKIVVFTDAAMGNINDGTGTIGAFVVWLMDNRGQCCPIKCSAHKIKRVIRSTLAAEALSLPEELEKEYCYREMLVDVLDSVLWADLLALVCDV